MENPVDQIRQLNIQAMSKSRQFYFSKKAFKILLSLFAFICLFSYSLFLPFLLHSYHRYLSTFSMVIFTYSTDRHYIFLLFNGILVFLIKNSGPITNSPLTTAHFKENRVEKTGHTHQPAFGLSSEMTPVAVEEAMAEDGGEEEEQNGILVISDNSGSIAQDDIKYEQVEQFLIVQEDEKTTEEDQEEEGNAEELNQRCEEFIRKMKERIKDEARH